MCPSPRLFCSFTLLARLLHARLRFLTRYEYLHCFSVVFSTSWIGFPPPGLRLLLGCVTTRKDWALWTWVRSFVWTEIGDWQPKSPLLCWHGRKINQTKFNIVNRFPPLQPPAAWHNIWWFPTPGQPGTKCYDLFVLTSQSEHCIMWFDVCSTRKRFEYSVNIKFV